MPKARVSGKPLTAAQRAQRSVAAKASAAKRKKAAYGGGSAATKTSVAVQADKFGRKPAPKLSPKDQGRAKRLHKIQGGYDTTARKNGTAVSGQSKKAGALYRAQPSYKQLGHGVGNVAHFDYQPGTKPKTKRQKSAALDGAMHARVSSAGTVKDPQRQVKANKRYKPLAQAAYAADKHPTAFVKAPITSSHKGASSPVKSSRAAGKRARKAIHGSDTRGR